MVEVFKTDATKHKEAMLLTALYEAFSMYRINFDLEDCDHILRIEGDSICNEKIIGLMNAYNCFCDVLE